MNRCMERATHILVECPELIASVRVGVLDALAPLEGGVCEVRFRETRRIERQDIQWCDILVCVRGSETLTQQVVSETKRHGRLVFYFLDDDLLHLPEDSLSRAYFDDGDHQKALRDILGQSDGLWGVNEEIRTLYLPLCGTQRWICSRVPARVRTRPAAGAGPGPVKVLYAGSTDHQNMVREILAPAVRAVIERCGDRVDFTFLGPDPQIAGCGQVHHRAFFDDHGQYRAFVEDGGFQIGLAPVRSGQFYQCKYYNKFVEYTSIGAVGIYTDSPLYRQIVVDGENGLLSGNAPEDWARSIVRLVEQPGLRERCRQAAESVLDDRFRPEAVSQELLAQIPEIQWYRAPAVSLRDISMRDLGLCFYMDRVRYLLRRYHLLAVPIVVAKAIKKIAKWLLRSICHHVQRIF